MAQAQYWVDGRCYAADDPGLQPALQRVHEIPALRPRCLCLADGVEMYVAKHYQFLVKRMPGSGHRHHPGCASYEPAPSESGLGELLGDAIVETLDAGTTLHLGFPFMHKPGRCVARDGGEPAADVAVSRRRLSLRALTHYLFERAGFNRWYPAMIGRRNQGVVHKYLTQAAEGVGCKGVDLASRLFVSEAFSEVHKPEQAARRQAKLAFLHKAQTDGGVALALIIGELKCVEACTSGQRLWIRHLPDVPLLIDNSAWQRAVRNYAALLSAFDGNPSHGVRVIVSAMIFAKQEHVYQVDMLSLMLTDTQWIPLNGIHEGDLVGRLIAEQRRFLKPLRYDARHAGSYPNVLLLDTGERATPLHVLSDLLDPGERAAKEKALVDAGGACWCWHTDEPCPALPPAVI